eukprot:9625150-Alexandrium_andersonii.AAC.1
MAALAKAKKSARADAALARAQGQGQARRGPAIHQASSMAARGISVLAQASGGADVARFAA